MMGFPAASAWRIATHSESFAAASDPPTMPTREMIVWTAPAVPESVPEIAARRLEYVWRLAVAGRP